MKISEMIEILQAYERGDVVEAQNNMTKLWEPLHAPIFNFQLYNYRIAPKKEMTLVEELRSNEGKAFWDVRKRAADRIEELEEILHRNIQRMDIDLMFAEIKRRVKC